METEALNHHDFPLFPFSSMKLFKYSKKLFKNRFLPLYGSASEGMKVSTQQKFQQYFFESKCKLTNQTS